MQDSAIRILCVEDEPDLREDLVDVLQECGYGVDAAHDGPTGFAMAQERCYDLILCDVLLPGMNGHQLVSELRQSVGASSNSPVIFLTAYADRKLHDDCTSLGNAQVIMKPVDYRNLESLVARWRPLGYVDKD